MEKARLFSLPGIPEGDEKVATEEENKRGKSRSGHTDWLISRCASMDGRWGGGQWPRREGAPATGPLIHCGSVAWVPYCASLPRSPPSPVTPSSPQQTSCPPTSSSCVSFPLTDKGSCFLLASDMIQYSISNFKRMPASTYAKPPAACHLAWKSSMMCSHHPTPTCHSETTAPPPQGLRP